MYKKLIGFIGLGIFSFVLPTTYEFLLDPVDVVIPCTSKDIRTLNLCIDGIKRYGKNINRVIVVSSEKLTDQAEWFGEADYPFSKNDIAYQIFKNEKKAHAYLNTPKNRIGWIYQQLLKLYASFVIPNLSSNVLILDSDTVFLNPVSFYDKKTGGGYFNSGTEYNRPYFTHAQKLIPGFKKVYRNHSGISHHMLFQRPVLEDLFQIVEDTHNQEFWRAACDCIDKKDIFACISEYEIYFNFTLARTNQCKIRRLKWANVRFQNLQKFRKQGYHYVSCHSYLG